MAKKTSKRPGRKKAYRRPTLEHYGNLRMITTLTCYGPVTK